MIDDARMRTLWDEVVRLDGAVVTETKKYEGKPVTFGEMLTLIERYVATNRAMQLYTLNLTKQLIERLDCLFPKTQLQDEKETP